MASLDVYDFPNIIHLGFQYSSLPWEWHEKTHLAFMRGISSVMKPRAF